MRDNPEACTIWNGRIDVLTGGFPCQPYSQAGKRLGTEDDRDKWPEMLRAVREIQPTWVVGENVLGLTNWNGGMVFEQVQADLEAEGYEVQSYVLPAAGVGAPHQRYRVFIVAYSTSIGLQRRRRRENTVCKKTQQKQVEICSKHRNASNTNSSRSQGSGRAEGQGDTGQDEELSLIHI